MAKWAVLIGVDDYPGLDEPALRGCRNDVEESGKMLCTHFGFDSNRIVRLLSPLPEAEERRDGQGASDNNSWPSYKAIVDNVRKIADEGQAGDMVYIHFSGYVVYVESKLPPRARSSLALDFALAPASVASNGRYLHDVELAVMLRDLCRRGMATTVVIDGRYHSLGIQPSSQSAFSPEELLVPFHEKWTAKDGSSTWLQAPDPGVPYACLSLLNTYGMGTHAPELYDEEARQWRGYLTSFLHSALAVGQLRLELRLLYSSCMLELARSVKQVDMWRALWAAGDMSRLFLLDDTSRQPQPPRFRASLRMRDEIVALEIRAGSAHGIEPGHCFLCLSTWSTKHQLVQESYEDGHVGLFRIAAVNSLTSTAVLCVDEDASAKVKDRLAQSDPACAAVYLPGWAQDPPRTTRRRPLAVPILSPNEHAMLYKDLLRIANADESLARCTSITILGGYRHEPAATAATAANDTGVGPAPPTFARDGRLHLLSGDCVQLHMQAWRGQELFVYILSFDSAFGVTQVYPTTPAPAQRLGEGLPLLDNNVDELAISLRVGLPRSRRDDPCFRKGGEVLKVFVTDQQSTFDGLELPTIADREFLQREPDPALSHVVKPPPPRNLVDRLANMREVVTSGPRLQVESLRRLGGDCPDENWLEDVLGPRPPHQSALERIESPEDVLERTAGLGLKGSWFCVDLAFVVHNSAESILAI